MPTNDPLHTLIVDDEEWIRFLLQKTLERSGHRVTTASNGEHALDLLQETPFDVILLDLMLGGPVDGQRVLEAVRWRWPATVVIMLTGHGSLESALEAIGEGIDGYLLKPVKPEEVRRAVEEALYRRQKLAEAADDGAEDHLLRQGRFAVDLQRHVATLNGQPLELSSGEMALLTALLRHAPEVVSPIDLVEAVRGYRPQYLYEARDVIKWYVHQLRNKVEPDPANPRYVVNVRGVGYRLVA
jgi:DNA-binding response OmpR family regulator